MDGGSSSHAFMRCTRGKNLCRDFQNSEHKARSPIPSEAKQSNSIGGKTVSIHGLLDDDTAGKVIDIIIKQIESQDENDNSNKKDKDEDDDFFDGYGAENQGLPK